VTPFLPFYGGAQAELRYFLDGQLIENRLWFSNDTGVVDATNLQGLADGLKAWWDTKLRPYISHDVTFRRTQVTRWDSVPNDILAFSSLNQPGGDSEASHSANVSMRVNFKWPLTIKERKNSNFVPGIPLRMIDNNTISSLFQVPIWSAYADLIDDTRLFSPVLTWRWVVTSSYDAGSLRPEQLWYSCEGPVAFGLFKIGQQRKRLP